MLITLWARAVESRRPDAIRRDPDAVRLMERFDHDFDRYAGGWKTQVGVAVRGRVLDRAVDRFLADHPGGVVVDLGAGLDTRSRRPGAERAAWLLVDRPDALAVRRAVLGVHAHEHLHDGGLEDPAWTKRAARLGGPHLVIAEGVLMFVPRTDVASMLDRVARDLPGTAVLADVIGPLMVWFPRLHDTLPATGVRFAWGVRHPRQLAAAGRPRRLRAWRCMLDEAPPRWRWMRLLRAIGPMRRQFAVVEIVCDAALAEDAGAGRDGDLGPSLLS